MAGTGFYSWHSFLRPKKYSNTKLISACVSGDLSTVKRLMAHGAGADIEYDDTPFRAACLNGNLNIVKALHLYKQQIVANKQKKQSKLIAKLPALWKTKKEATHAELYSPETIHEIVIAAVTRKNIEIITWIFTQRHNIILDGRHLYEMLLRCISRRYMSNCEASCNIFKFILSNIDKRDWYNIDSYIRETNAKLGNHDINSYNLFIKACCYGAIDIIKLLLKDIKPEFHYWFILPLNKLSGYTRIKHYISQHITNFHSGNVYAIANIYINCAYDLISHYIPIYKIQCTIYDYFVIHCIINNSCGIICIIGLFDMV